MANAVRPKSAARGRPADQEVFGSSWIKFNDSSSIPPLEEDELSHRILPSLLTCFSVWPLHSGTSGLHLLAAPAGSSSRTALHVRRSGLSARFPAPPLVNPEHARRRAFANRPQSPLPDQNPLALIAPDTFILWQRPRHGADLRHAHGPAPGSRTRCIASPREGRAPRRPCLSIFMRSSAKFHEQFRLTAQDVAFLARY